MSRFHCRLHPSCPDPMTALSQNPCARPPGPVAVESRRLRRNETCRRPPTSRTAFSRQGRPAAPPAAKPPFAATVLVAGGSLGPAFDLWPSHMEGGQVWGLLATIAVALGLLATRAALRQRRAAEARATKAEQQLQWARAESALNRRRARELAVMAKSAKALRNEFLSNISHEVRTPMNAIMGMTELALETELSPRQRRYLQQVRDAADNLLGLLNDLLDLSKLHARQLRLHPVPFHPFGCIEDLAAKFARIAREKGLELHLDISQDLPMSILGDPGQLKQATGALLSNAVKFTDEGRVDLRVTCEPAGPRKVRLQVAVSDTGVGIPPEQQALIFEAFRQVDGSETRRYGGCGIGLTLAAQLVSLMNGQLRLESQPGRGSTFHFTAEFEIASPAEPLAALCGPDLLREQPVLVLSPCRDMREALEILLAAVEMNPLPIEDAATALDALRQACRKGHRVPLVVIDGSVSEEATARLVTQLAQEPEFGQPRVIITVSAGKRGDAEMSRRLGIAGYLTRPFTKAELAEAIALVLAPAPEDGANQRPLVTIHLVRDRHRAARGTAQPAAQGTGDA